MSCGTAERVARMLWRDMGYPLDEPGFLIELSVHIPACDGLEMRAHRYTRLTKHRFLETQAGQLHAIEMISSQWLAKHARSKSAMVDRMYAVLEKLRRRLFDTAPIGWRYLGRNAKPFTGWHRGRL